MDASVPADIDEDAVHDAVVEFFRNQHADDLCTVTSKDLRRYVEINLDLPQNSLKTPKGTAILVRTTAQCTAMLQQIQRLDSTADSTNQTKDGVDTDSSADRRAAKSSEERNCNICGDEAESEDELVTAGLKKGKYTRLEAAIIVKEAQDFAKEWNIDIQQLTPFFRSPAAGARRPWLKTKLWSRIQQRLPCRTRQSIYNWAMRWLLRDVSHSFDQQEVATLKALMEVYGRNWNKIAAAMGKTPDACRQAELRCINKRKRSGQKSLGECAEIVRAVYKLLGKDVGAELPASDISWSALASTLNNVRTALDYQRFWMTLLNYINKAGGVEKFLTLADANPSASSKAAVGGKSSKAGGARKAVASRISKLESCRRQIKLLELLQEGGYTEDQEVVWYDVDRHEMEYFGSSRQRWRLMLKECPSNDPAIYTFEEKVQFMLEKKRSKLRNMELLMNHTLTTAAPRRRRRSHVSTSHEDTGSRDVTVDYDRLVQDDLLSNTKFNATLVADDAIDQNVDHRISESDPRRVSFSQQHQSNAGSATDNELPITGTKKKKSKRQKEICDGMESQQFVQQSEFLHMKRREKKRRREALAAEEDSKIPYLPPQSLHLVKKQKKKTEQTKHEFMLLHHTTENLEEVKNRLFKQEEREGEEEKSVYKEKKKKRKERQMQEQRDISFQEKKMKKQKLQEALTAEEPNPESPREPLQHLKKKNKNKKKEMKHESTLPRVMKENDVKVLCAEEQRHKIKEERHLRKEEKRRKRTEQKQQTLSEKHKLSSTKIKKKIRSVYET